MLHSPLGGSGAERWLNCPGSVALIASLPPSGDFVTDPDYTRRGIAAHKLAAHCLRNNLEIWEAYDANDRLSDDDLNAIQFYITDRCDCVGFVEEHIAAPELHRDAFGTIDHFWFPQPGHVEITDYKHGEGIWVDAQNNTQLLYYASLLSVKYPKICWFNLRIVQPRCRPFSGPREFEITHGHLQAWINDVLKPGMRRVFVDQTLNPGTWCRFCPVNKANVCPALLSQISTVQSSEPVGPMLTDEGLGRLYVQAQQAKLAIKSIEKEVEKRRLEWGREIPGSKTVQKMAYRVWKKDAPLELYMETKPKSPSAVEDMLGGKEFVREWAYTPDAGYTIAPLTDRRHAVTLPNPAKTFGGSDG